MSVSTPSLSSFFTLVFFCRHLKLGKVANDVSDVTVLAPVGPPPPPAGIGITTPPKFTKTPVIGDCNVPLFYLRYATFSSGKIPFLLHCGFTP